MIAGVIAVFLLLVIAAYACGGGTDYGAGFWDLTAGGAERGERPRRLIDHAMEPVWEVNNVWLIFVLVVMWTGFPVFFQQVFTTMWLPLTLAALGIVLRGAGFALRKPMRRLVGRRLYGAVFAVASLLTPFFLGAAVGGVASGRVSATTTASTDAWANPTSLLFGLLAIACSATLGAVFLAADARRFEAPDLDRYFRPRALAALGCVAVLAIVTLVVTHGDAPHVWHGLTHGAGLVFVVIAVVATAATVWLLTRASGAWSRVAAVGMVASAVIAWGTAQRPYLIPTSLTIAAGAGAPTTLRWLGIVIIVALVLVIPAVAVLYWLDTQGELEGLTDAELRRGGTGEET
ncbi:cytochrome d ubiquinol oxidase subunit II [Streptomyces collinus]|uniref:Cytochrome bd-I oxidase subunit II n=1 Tax=Streptomyces collinus (strain DSM 40733 / Tue 365) TaxID=1214242 RepID=S5UZ67_STRC3|nr:cytochrome d ubiquinol oxidase subunit II [Streptomyces collinus]AGS71056.1 cytochrome bd-I oxidase subunit II [Streptomyces collinus Tu 365]UJA09707.1 cytochrome d ubiquinol oxidase subunit II [Streptomyces collinus]UJA15429.1 cytochrome d ubiquinol oxidase subunit II [Streptomyces collinus]